LGSSTLLATGLATDNTALILAVAITMSFVVFGRWLGVFADGFDKKVTFPLVAEMLMVVIFYVTVFTLGV